jgi:uncharacterized protein YijF (DUF1287 family)
MRIRLIRTQRDFQFPFPGGVEPCANALFFKVGLGSDDKFEMVVAYTTRSAHERNRRRVHVGLKVGSTYRSLVQFEGTDDYSETGDCICVIKRAENSEQIPVHEPVPLEYAGHRLAIFERHVEKGGKDHWGIIVNEGEIDDMLRIGLIRAGHKGYKETP